MKPGEQRIGLYGGTFNPVHNGHVSAVKSFLDSGEIDTLWILLNPAPPHKPDEEFAPYSARLMMLRETFKSIKEVEISDLETRLPAPGYTIQTVRYLVSKYPEYRFFLCIGLDSMITFHHWFKWKEILDSCSLLAVERPRHKGKKPNQKVLARTHFVPHQPVEVSSSVIREKVAAGKAIKELVPPVVAKIIENHNLYK